MERLEDTILRNLLYNDDFVRKSLPYLKNDYFLEHTDKILFEEINKFIQKYNVSPTNNISFGRISGNFSNIFFEWIGWGFPKL